MRISRAIQVFAAAGLPDFRKAQQDESRTADEARLSAAVDALTPAEARAYGRYRLSA